MAPNVTLHFFHNDDLNGSYFLELTDESPYLKAVTLKPKFYEVGGGELILARGAGVHFAHANPDRLDPETFVRVLVHAYSDTDYYWGFFLNKRDQLTVHRDEDGAEEYHLGGSGPKFYLDRAVAREQSFIGEGFHLDEANGVWRWSETAPAGKILNRLLLEAHAADIDPIPDLTDSFSPSTDSNGDAWATDIAGNNDYEIPIGESYLNVLWDLEDASGLVSTVNLGTVSAPVLELEGWNSYGTDVTAADPASGKVILREGLNIGSLGGNLELTVHGRSLKKATHVIVEGKDGVYEFVEKPSYSPGDYAKIAKIEYSRSSNPTILNRAGIRWLRRQDNADNAITVPIVPGASEATGYYFPTPDGPLWFGNTITLDTSEPVASSLDYQNEDQLVTGFELKLAEAGDTATATTKARSWEVSVDLNKERGGAASSPDQTSSATGNNACKCLKLCSGGIACEDLAASDLTAATAVNGDAEDTGGGQWGGTGGSYQTTHFFDGIRSFGSLAITDADFAYTFDPAQVFVAGTRYVLDIYARQQWTSAEPNPITFGVSGGDETSGGHDLGTFTGADGLAWEHWRLCWTPTANRTGVRARWHVVQSNSGYYVLDALELSTAAPGEELVGTGDTAARCDHTHHAADLIGELGVIDHGALSGLTDDDHPQYLLAFSGGQGDLNTVAASGSTETIDLASGNFHHVTLTVNCTFTFTGATNGKECAFTLLVKQDGTGSRLATWPGTVVWASGSAPVLSTAAGAIDVFIFFSVDGGSIWYGFEAGAGGSSVGSLDDLSDVTITAPAEHDMLRYDGAEWVNQSTRWEPVTFNFGTGPELVWDGDDLVMEWKAY